jgi:sugar phosphate isomerase/epimerase
MKKLDRRRFIGQSAMGLGTMLAFSQFPEMLKAHGIGMKAVQPIGFQTFPIRDLLAKDFAGTLKTMSGFGYQLVEMCSPSGYATIGFGSFVNMKTADIRSTIEDAGLHCPSCHFTMDELTNKLDERIDFAHALGLSQMICSTFWLPATATIKDYKDSADKLNKIAAKIKSAGMHTGFHNHHFEFAQLEGQLIYDALMSEFDPDLVKMQFQTQVVTLGYKAADYFNKYPGRFISSHLSDWTTDKKEVPIGQGVIDWKAFFVAAKTGGVKNFFVEMRFETFKDSASYIQGLLG